MFKMTPITAHHFDLFRTLFGFFAVLMVGSLLLDRSLLPAFGWMSQVAMVVGSVSALSWALNWRRKLAATFFLVCLAIIVETNQSALRVMPGYAGWIFFMSLFVDDGEGCRLRRAPANAGWTMPKEVQLATMVVLAGTFTYSGITKALNSFWIEGRAIEVFASNPRLNWNFDFVKNMNPWISAALTYATLIVEVLFLPLYLLRRTRRLAWFSLVGLFLGILLVMRIYLVAIGILTLLIILYEPRSTKIVA